MVRPERAVDGKKGRRREKGDSHCDCPHFAKLDPGLRRDDGEAPESGQPLPAVPNRRFETSATCFDCRLSQEILDGDNGWLTT